MFSVIEIGTRISSARNLKGLTLEDVASKVGVAKSTILRYEKGTISKTKLPVLESIAHALGVDPNWLIGNSDNPYVVSTPAQALNVDEAQLLDDYRDAEEPIRQAAAVMLHDSAERNREEKKRKSGSAG